MREALNPIEEACALQRLTDEFRYTHNKNDTGCIRIPFHDKAHMQMILDKWGMKDSIDLMSDTTE